MERFSVEVLYQWLSKYKNREHAFNDIKRVNFAYKGLIPHHEDYTFNDGTTKKLVNMKGTIPVMYKGSTYNIPICVWLMDTYPKHAPICYVEPTSDMAIKQSKYVDQNGKIYLPYLHDWLSGSSNIFGLIQVMAQSFGEIPPVFAKTRSDSSHPPTFPAQSRSSYTPPYPTSSYTPSPSFTYNMPPYPTTATNSVPFNPPYGGAAPYPPTPYPPNFSSGSFGLPAMGGGGGGGGGAGTTSTTNQNSGTIKDEHIRNSLISAIEDKLLRRMKEQYQQNQAELDSLKRTHDELKDGKTKLDNILQMLEKDENDLNRNVSLLKEKDSELTSAIEKLSTDEQIDVDDAVTTTTPLYKQLLNSFAEEAALEDAIYYMGEALRCGVIDLEVFLKQVRALSRKQFMLRALMQKNRQKAGLPI